MTSSYWPLADLRLQTPDLPYPRDRPAYHQDNAAVIARGIADPAQPRRQAPACQMLHTPDSHRHAAT